MTKTLPNVYYLVLFLAGLVVTFVLFLLRPQNNLVNALLDIPRTVVVGLVYLLLTHFVGGGVVSTSTVLPFGLGAILSLILTEYISTHFYKPKSKAPLPRKKHS